VGACGVVALWFLRAVRVELAPARVGIGGVRSLRGCSSLLALGFVRSGFAQIGGALVVGVAGCMHQYRKSVDNSSSSSNAIRKKDTPACGCLVFWYKRRSFLWVVAAARYVFILSLVRQDQGSLRPPDLRTWPPAEGNKEKPF